MTDLMGIMVVTLMIWVGLFAYVYRLDRKVGRLEDFLLESLDRRFSLGPLKFLKKRKNPLRDDSISAICESLGSIGTGKSVATLQKLEKQHDSLWENKAREALKKIAERSG